MSRLEALAEASIQNETDIRFVLDREQDALAKGDKVATKSEMAVNTVVMNADLDEKLSGLTLEKRCTDIENALDSKLNESEVNEILAEGCGKAFDAFGEFLETRFSKIETDLDTLAVKLNVKLEHNSLPGDG